MIAIPEALDGMLEFPKDGSIRLKGGATKEQKQAFREFMDELNSSDGCMKFETPFDKD